jgi:tetratricopeptide (TPR) repeat protein
MKRYTRVIRLLAACLILSAVGSARAVWPLGDSDQTKAEKLATQGNAELQAADELWRANQSGPATERYQAAAEIFRQAEATSPGLENGRVRFRLSYCLAQVEQIRNAAREKAGTEKRVTVTRPPATGLEGARETAVETPMDPVELRRELVIAQRLLSGDQPETALPSLVKVLKSDPGNHRALLLMATLRVKQGRFDDAIVTIEDLRGTSGEDEAVLLLAAGAYCGAGRHFDALLALDKAMKKNPKLPQAHLNMAYLLLEMSPDKRAEADAYYRQALKLGGVRDASLEKRLGVK